MKKIVLLLVLALFAGLDLSAQQQLPPSSKPDIELTKKEAEFRIQDYQSKVNALEAQLQELTSKLTDSKSSLTKSMAQFKDCREEIKRLLAITDADIDAFRQKLGVIEGKVRQMKALSDDQLADRQDEVKALEESLNQLRGNKASLIPEFYNKIIAVAKDIKGLYRTKKVTTYTVGTWAEDRDCLWNIAGKIEILGDPFLWPKVWQTNKSIVKNPDIIYPGQVLTLPEKGVKTSDEMKAERKYWREKRARAAKAAEAKAAEPKAPATTPAPAAPKKGN